MEDKDSEPLAPTEVAGGVLIGLDFLAGWFIIGLLAYEALAGRKVEHWWPGLAVLGGLVLMVTGLLLSEASKRRKRARAFAGGSGKAPPEGGEVEAEEDEGGPEGEGGVHPLAEREACEGDRPEGREV